MNIPFLLSRASIGHIGNVVPLGYERREYLAFNMNNMTKSQAEDHPKVNDDKICMNN